MIASVTDEVESHPRSSPAGDVLRGHELGLDGLRTVCMAAVLAYHAELPFARGGFLGLSLFFTLSGFLVTAVLLRASAGGTFRPAHFWMRRVRRLMPASLAGLALIALFGATVATKQQADGLPGQMAAAAANVANWKFIADGTSYIDLFSGPSPVQHYWSLSVEEQYYFIVPLVLLAVLARPRPKRTLAFVFAGGALASTAWMAYLYDAGASLDRLYYGTDTRLAEILIGAVLALFVARVGRPAFDDRRRTLGWAGAGAAAALLWLTSSARLTEPWLWRGGFAATALLTSLVIVGVLGGVGPLRALSWGPVAATGRVTYGVYVYHFPIFLWLTEARTGLSLWPLFGVRVAVTMVLAVASYHLLEMPVRRGWRLPGPKVARLAFGPLVAVALVAVALATAGDGAEDPQSALRLASSSLPPPAIPGDGVLDVLVVGDANGSVVADHMEAELADDPAVDITQVLPFSCDELVSTPQGRVCQSWLDEWVPAVAEHDPDVVLLYVDDWPSEDIQRLAGVGLLRARPVAREVLGAGMSLLTANGARVVWTSTGADLTQGVARGTAPFHRAMSELVSGREDLRWISTIPYTADVHDPAFLETADRIIIDELLVAQRGAATTVPRIMIVGDSQARAVGYGLERWALSRGDAVVWNVATQGCGLTVDGIVRQPMGGEDPALPLCVEAKERWADNLAEFDPDQVIVMSGLQEVSDRRLDGWDDFEGVGEERLDGYLVDQFTEVTDTLASTGATVTWLSSPCLRYVSPLGLTGDPPSAFDPERTRHVNEVLLPEVIASRPGTRLVDLDERLCPDGEFLEEVDDVGVLRPDGIHLTAEASVWLAESLGPEILEGATPEEGTG